MSNDPSTSSSHVSKGTRFKDYTVFYRVIEQRCTVVRASSPKQARLRVEEYLDNDMPVPASIHADTQSLVTKVRARSVSIDVDLPEIAEADLPY